ncbi:MAG: GntR family transcriptional regulator [Acidobacteria bacterium]|nr:MAG: GntR family transcriptional regulator [Acidobacteriota bacterium]
MADLLSIEHSELGEKVYTLIRQEILLRRFQAGEKLDIYRLADQLGVSRTPVKDAVNRLALEGLIEIVPRRGTFVTKFGRRDIEELFDARCMVELWAAQKAMKRVTDEQIRQLEEVVGEGARILKKADGAFDYQAFSVLNARFHRLMLELSGSRKLIEIYDSLHTHVQVTRAMSQRALEACRLAQAEHEKIVGAYQRRDLKGLKAAITAHLESTLEGSLKVMEERGGAL